MGFEVEPGALYAILQSGIRRLLLLSNSAFVKETNLQDIGSANLLWDFPWKIQYQIDIRSSGPNKPANSNNIRRFFLGELNSRLLKTLFLFKKNFITSFTKSKKNWTATRVTGLQVTTVKPRHTHEAPNTDPQLDVQTLHCDRIYFCLTRFQQYHRSIILPDNSYHLFTRTVSRDSRKSGSRRYSTLP